MLIQNVLRSVLYPIGRDDSDAPGPQVLRQVQPALPVLFLAMPRRDMPTGYQMWVCPPSRLAQ